jgi:3-phosphoshikimate 1-carboxyvinyltransferase
MKLVVNRVESLSGQISVPGDKSISHRSIMMGALAEGVTNVTGFLAADDCISTMRCFKSLGV